MEVDLAERADELEQKARELEEAAREVAPMDGNGSSEARVREENEALDEALKDPLEMLRRVGRRH